MKKVRIFGIIGGSGVGKSEQIRLLLNHYPDILKFSVSATTRDKGEQEVDGQHYHFLTKEEFERREQNDEFLEANPFVTGHRYGTLKSELDAATAQGKILLVDIEMNGAMSVYRQYPEESCFVFLDAADEAVRKRLAHASTRKREKIDERIAELQHQRSLAHAADSGITLHIDTTAMDIGFVYNIVANKLNEEIAFRKSASYGPLVT